MMRRNQMIVILFAISCFVVACKGEMATVEGSVEYKLLTIEKGNFSTTINYSASIKGMRDIDIYPQVGGYLSSIKVVEGESVKRGDVLFVIEQAPYQAAYQAALAGEEVAKVGVATAQLNFDNGLELHNKNIISTAELQTIKNSLEGAKAQLALAQAQSLSAKTNLDFTVIKSPSSGVVGKLPYRQGALVSAALPQPLTVVSDNSKMYVYFSMTENQILNLLDKYGSIDSVVSNMPQIDLQLNNGSIYSEKGIVESISGIIENNIGVVSVRAVFPNKKRHLISGGAGNVIIPQNHEDVIVIPKEATYEIQNKIFTNKVVDGKTKSVVIEVLPSSNNEEYVVTSGLVEGDVIIAEGAGLVREGTPVKQ